MNRIIWLLIGAGLSPLVAAANLTDTFHTAQANDPAYAAARASYRAGIEKLPQARAGLLPQISVGASAIHNNTDSSAFGQLDYTTKTATIQLLQPLYRKQSYAQYAQAQQQVNAAEAQLSNADQELVLRVAQAYFDVLQSQDALRFVQAQQAAIGEQLAQAKRSFEVGSATITDSNEAQARADLANAQAIAARNDLDLKRRALARIVGTPPGTLAVLGNTLQTVAPDPANLDTWIARAEANSPQLKAQRAAFNIARLEIERNRAGHYPTLDAVASYSDIRDQNFGSFQVNNKSTQIGLQLTLPLYQGGLVNSRVREAVANQDKARAELEDTRRQIELNTSQAYLGVTSGAAQVTALEQAQVSSQTSLASSKLGLEVGVRTTLDVLNAQQQLYATERDLAAARYAYLLSGLRLKAAAGSLTEADLAAVDQLLIPAR